MQNILKSTEEYYSAKVRQHGTSPQGADWKDQSSQEVRFDQILKIVQGAEPFMLADLGCGYGAMFSYMNTKKFPGFEFYGYDLSPDMIENAKAHTKAETANKAIFQVIEKPADMAEADYVTASGIFNVKMQHSDAEWHDYIIETLSTMNAKARKGFSFNVLTKYSDKEYMRDDLHYADPLALFDYCKKNFSRNVALIHDYELYEFTMLVRK